MALIVLFQEPVTPLSLRVIPDVYDGVLSAADVPRDYETRFPLPFTLTCINSEKVHHVCHGYTRERGKFS